MEVEDWGDRWRASQMVGDLCLDAELMDHILEHGHREQSVHPKLAGFERPVEVGDKEAGHGYARVGFEVGVYIRSVISWDSHPAVQQADRHRAPKDETVEMGTGEVELIMDKLIMWFRRSKIAARAVTGVRSFWVGYAGSAHTLHTASRRSKENAAKSQLVPSAVRVLNMIFGNGGTPSTKSGQ